jgi:PDZ domain-containing protein
MMSRRLQHGGGPPRRLWLRRHYRVTLVIAVVVALIVGLIYSIHRAHDYYTIAPGQAPAISTSKACQAHGGSYTLTGGKPCVLLQAPAARLHVVSGGLLMVDVTLGPTTAGQYIVNKVGLLDHTDAGAQLLPASEVLGDTPASQYNQLNDQFMAVSSQSATVVALRRLGYRVTEQDEGVLIGGLVKGSPAAGHLQAGDTIVAVDGKPIGTNAQLVAIIHRHQSGDRVVFTVVPPTGKRQNVTLRLGRYPAGVLPPGTPPDTAFVGISELETTMQFRYPFNVQIDAGNIGGPSAGLAFTLAILDYLGNGQLTGGHLVAATGTMNLDGSVGEVGGVKQKAIAVRRAGAQLFLVPQAEYSDAKAEAGSTMKVVGVTNLDQALNALAAVGGNVARVRATG